MTAITRETLIRCAATMEADEYKDDIILHLGRRNYNAALDICGKAIFKLIKKQEGRSPSELDKIWERCRKYEYLERMLLRKTVLVEQGSCRTPQPGKPVMPRRPKTRAEHTSRHSTNHSHR